MTDDIVARLRAYDGRIWETTVCYNGLREEAADALEQERGDARTLRGFIATYKMTPSMMASRAETAEARVRELQASLMFWMPGVRDEDSADNERAADDAYLLAGFDGELSQRCWGDEMLTRVRELEAVNAALNERAAQYERLYRDATAETIERCARVAVSHISELGLSDNPAYVRFEPADMMARKIAAAIRNLAQEVKHEAE